MAGPRTGIENYLHHLLPGLVREWRSGGGEVVVFAPDPAVAAHVSPPVQVVPGGGRGWTQLRLPGAASRAGVDVYFSPIPVLPLLFPMPCPAVVTVHDLLEFRPRWWYFRRLIGRTLGRAAAVICVSQATLAEVAASFPAAAARAVVVREAADPGVFHEVPGEATAEAGALAGLGIAQPPVLAVGTIQPRKNYARLLDAYARVTAGLEDPPHLVVVGRPGWDFEEVLALPAKLGIAPRVHLAGHLPEAEVAALMRASLVLAAVSTAEGFGLPLVEAMHSGLPVLAADIPPFREVAGTAALFVNPTSTDDIAAGLARLLADASLRRELVEAGRARRGLFSWERASREVCATLRGALTAV
jgi:glycosyltransferase involved in cell wall biosynthesis